MAVLPAASWGSRMPGRWRARARDPGSAGRTLWEHGWREPRAVRARFLRRQPVPGGDARAISEPVTGIWHLVLGRRPHLWARVHEHDDLLRAIANGDADVAREIIAEHIENFEREIRAVL